MRARVTLRGLVPLESDGSDVVGIGVVPWTALEPVDERFGPVNPRFAWMDECGRVVRSRELGGRGVFEVELEAKEGKRNGNAEKRLAVARRAWARAVGRAARDGSLVVVWDQRGAWWLEVAIWSVAIATAGALAVWWYRSQVAPLLGASDAASVGLVIIMGVVCLCWPGIVLMLMWPRRDVLCGRVARWSRIDASGIRAGWSLGRTEHFSWEEIADASVFGLRPHRIVTSAGSEVKLSISARGLEWINQRIWVPRLEAMEAESAEREEEDVPPESEGEEGATAELREGPSAETLEAMAAERRAFERRWRPRTVIACLCVGLVVGVLMAVYMHSQRDASFAWTFGAGVSGFAMGSLVMPLVLGVLWVLGRLGRMMRARKDRGVTLVPARITLAGLVPEKPEEAGGVTIAPWVELWRGARGYEWRDAERRWVRRGTRERIVFTLDWRSARTHEFEERDVFARLLRRGARRGELAVAIDQRGAWCLMAGVLGMEVVVPLVCAAAMASTVSDAGSGTRPGLWSSWDLVGWVIVGVTGAGVVALTGRDWRELWRSPARVKADSTGLALRTVTGRTRRVTWADVHEVRRGSDLRIETRSGSPFSILKGERVDALLEVRARARVRHNPERNPLDARNALRFAMIACVFVSLVGIYAMVSNGKPIFPGAVHAGMTCGGLVLVITGLMLAGDRLSKRAI